ncbi:ABC transporter substrate-binding protein [Labrys wisconsinensis]|uniref:Spermidine/putrescine transport system substrate-binding protein n=1 Tax=Labrys wisconsinensis TaxID=425677 RepID=A0ABU0JDW8_9HYPH|nr:ABC transporter substrate-binding protein [Labrys wisconsinensis]MDQ0471810.1 putative spermidine/putrescine transport system substrate-binding protein [Labrys wisconsinensis]
MSDLDVRQVLGAARHMERRSFLKLLGAGAAAASFPTLAAWSDRAAAQSAGGELVVASWGGSTGALHKKHFFDPFTRVTGIKVVDVSPTSYGKLKSMVEAGSPEWDVTLLIDIGQAKRAMNEGLVEPIDYGVVHAEDLIPAARGSHWTAGEIETVLMGYRTDTFHDAHPTSWADFWNVEKFPGLRGLHNWCVTTMEAALLADGVAPKALYPLDIDRAFASLDRLKPHVKVWWDVSAQGNSQQLLKDHEVDVLNGWTGRFGPLILGGDPVNMEYGQGLYTIAPWVVVKGARNPRNAMLFLDFIAQPEPQAALHSELIYGPTNPKALALIKPEIARLLPTNPDNFAKTVPIDSDYWQAHEAEVTERFTAWLLT